MILSYMTSKRDPAFEIEASKDGNGRAVVQFSIVIDGERFPPIPDEKVEDGASVSEMLGEMLSLINAAQAAWSLGRRVEQPPVFMAIPELLPEAKR